MVIETNVSIKLMPMECSCGSIYGISEEKYNYCLETGHHWFCPNGCRRIFCEPVNSKLRDKIESLERQKHNLNEVIDIHKRTIEQLGYSVRAQKAAKTKIINRVKNGICPCCNRTFQNLQNHFKSKHPELLST